MLPARENPADSAPPYGPTPFDPPTPPKPPTPGWVTGFKEVVTAVVGLAIVAVSLTMLVETYWSAEIDEPTAAELGQPALLEAQERIRLEQKSDRKDTLMIAVGLLGSVVGYYFGRVPAELNAANAGNLANQATANLHRSVSNLSRAENARERAEGKVAEALVSAHEIRLAVAGELESVPEPELDLRRRIDSLIERLGG